MTCMPVEIVMDKITTEVNVLVIPVEIDLAILLGHTVLVVLLILPTDFLSHTARTRSGQSGDRVKATIDPYHLDVDAMYPHITRSSASNNKSSPAHSQAIFANRQKKMNLMNFSGAKKRFTDKQWAVRTWG